MKEKCQLHRDAAADQETVEICYKHCSQPLTKVLLSENLNDRVFLHKFMDHLRC